MTLIIDDKFSGICLAQRNHGFCGQQTERTVRVITAFGHRIIQYMTERCPCCNDFERIIWARQYNQEQKVVRILNRFK